MVFAFHMTGVPKEMTQSWRFPKSSGYPQSSSILRFGIFHHNQNRWFISWEIMYKWPLIVDLLPKNVIFYSHHHSSGWWFQTFFNIWDVDRMSSFPLTNSYFSRWVKPPTRHKPSICFRSPHWWTPPKSRLRGVTPHLVIIDLHKVGQQHQTIVV